MGAKFMVVIPARYGASRLPGKPLLELAGRPMIAHVYARALESGAERVIIATDDHRVEAAGREFGAEVMLTGASHASGTERTIEVVERLALDPDAIVVNVQGDEPLIPPQNIACVASNLARRQAEVATLCEPLEDPKQVFDPDVVKVVMDGQGYALYFSRAPIPWQRDEWRELQSGELRLEQARVAADTHYRHVGIYAYRVAYLHRYGALSSTPLEAVERLEQLRVLYHGGRIHVGIAPSPSARGVDTAQDLAAVRDLLDEGD